MRTWNWKHVIAALREYEAELRRAGIQRLAVFGSVARGESTPDSDVDLFAEFDDARQFSMLDMVGIENRLSDILRKRVDLAPLRMLKDSVRERAVREAVFAF